ncbi:response regulator transcription factor [Blastococcus sp. SYSU D00868]
MVVDDNDLVRDALVELLDSAPSLSVVAECSDGEEVPEAARQARPDVVLMDIAMPRVDGLEAARRLLLEDPGSRVVVLTGSLTVDHVRRAHALGAAGFLLKDGNPAELLAAIRTVAEGGTAWSASAEPHLPPN